VALTGDILVLGLGRSGEAVVRYLAEKMAPGGVSSITALDEGDSERLQALRPKLEALGVRVGLATTAVEGRFHLAVASPGIAPSKPLFRAAAAASDRMISEIEFAFEQSCSPWIAVTGTNGKTTTTSLIAHLIAADGMPVETVGNIGRPAATIVGEATCATAIVAEVSSFQLALTERFCPRVSVLLNVTPDHIDWHGTLDAYVADKVRIFANQGGDDTAVIDVDDAGSAPYADRVAATGVRVVRVSRERLFPNGASVVDGVLALDTPHGVVKLVRPQELRILGEHNVSNALAAAAAAHAFGVTADSIRAGLRAFEPIEHRLEPAGDVAGVEYFNDSKATNPDAVLKALTAFGDRPLVVLLGGRNKDNDFGPLAVAVAARCRGAVLFGEAADEFAQAFGALALPVERVADLASAVRAAAGMARPGDAVLLSPGCASFDEFSGYEERGRTFKGLVADLAEYARLGGDA
jgi:UDP-N-acetylmuramoylalanine--D-glutamate ligase